MLNFPPSFLERAKNFAGDEYERFVQSLAEPAPVSIRMNPNKRQDLFSGEERIPWSKEGKYLKERPSFTLDPFFHAGCYYVQDASSQFLEQPFLQAKKLLNAPIRVLDLCAAPGGKSTHLLSLLDPGDVLISNEVIPTRNSILKENVTKWGCSYVIITQNDPAAFEQLKGFFDVVVVDAPCSGEGLFRKDPAAIQEWSVENVNRCSIRQKNILSSAIETLAPGGFLIYSTCTFEEEENDLQIDYLIQTFGMKKVSIENLNPDIVSSKNGLSFYPHRIRGEGFYISLVQKENGSFYRLKNEKPGSDKFNYRKFIDEYLLTPNDFLPVYKEGRLYAISAKHFQTFRILSEKFYLRLAGISMGEIKGNDFIPSEALALSVFLNPDIPHMNLSEPQIIDYLKGGTPEIPDASKGWNVVRFQNHSLGWIKNLGNRMNNYYPKEWRIKNDKIRNV